MSSARPEAVPGSEVVMPLHTDEDVVRLRKQVRDAMVALKFSLIEQTRMITAASELARNTLRYGGGGSAYMTHLQRDSGRGLEVTFIDEGPGIANLDLAMTDGYTSGGGLGLGLGGAKRLADEFTLDSAPGRGTKVSITKWKLF